MTRRLNPRHRQTLLGHGVGRAAGFYAQCDHRSRNDATIRFHPRAPVGSFVALGLVGLPGSLGHHVLRSIAGSDRLSDFDVRTVSVTDLLGQVHLDADADLIMWHGADGSRIATPIARLLEDCNSALLLGGPDQTTAPQWSAPVVLRSPHVPNQEDVEVVALTAMTFTQFIGGET